MDTYRHPGRRGSFGHAHRRARRQRDFMNITKSSNIRMKEAIASVNEKFENHITHKLFKPSYGMEGEYISMGYYEVYSDGYVALQVKTRGYHGNVLDSKSNIVVIEGHEELAKDLAKILRLTDITVIEPPRNRSWLEWLFG